MRKIDIESERIFENKKIIEGDVRKNQSKFYWATDLCVADHNAKSFDKISSKDVMEIGCSYGKDAKNYAKFCNSYVGIDISDEAIKKAQSLNLSNCKFICTDGHELPFPDKSFDYVIVNSLLHHLDLESTFKEIHRVLKDDGGLIFREPLGTNPLFQLYRMSTPAARTPDERPFTFGDLDLMKKYFHLEDIRWFGFTNILSAFLKNEAIRFYLTKLDDLLSVTPLKYFFWQFQGVARKRSV